jgi:SAM-dependent methyltransferase
MRKPVLYILCYAIIFAGMYVYADDHKALAAAIIKQSGFKAGLIVHLGCGDGALTAELSQKSKFLVHGLDTDTSAIEKARKIIHSQGIYGRVSVTKGTFKRLPYTENLINLLVADNLPRLVKQGLTFKEILRVLIPGSIAYVGQRPGIKQSILSASKLKALLAESGIKDYEIISNSGLWVKIRKPLHVDAKVWKQGTHYLNGNAVYQDTSGPFIHLQWISGPPRSASRYKGANRIASANGRNFYVYPHPYEGLLFEARDAFNGLLLWKRPVKKTPSLIAIGDRLYTNLNGPLQALDAATGEMIIE